MKEEEGNRYGAVSPLFLSSRARAPENLAAGRRARGHTEIFGQGARASRVGDGWPARSCSSSSRTSSLTCRVSRNELDPVSSATLCLRLLHCCFVALARCDFRHSPEPLDPRLHHVQLDQPPRPTLVVEQPADLHLALRSALSNSMRDKWRKKRLVSPPSRDLWPAHDLDD